MPDENGMPNYPFDGERPPGAPDSPFFWQVSAALLKLDGLSQDMTFEQVCEHLGIEADAISYMGNQRFERGVEAMMPLTTQKLIHLAGSMWLDGFVAGVAMQQARP